MKNAFFMLEPDQKAINGPKKPRSSLASGSFFGKKPKPQWLQGPTGPQGPRGSPGKSCNLTEIEEIIDLRVHLE